MSTQNSLSPLPHPIVDDTASISNQVSTSYNNHTTLLKRVIFDYPTWWNIFSFQSAFHIVLALYSRVSVTCNIYSQAIRPYQHAAENESHMMGLLVRRLIEKRVDQGRVWILPTALFGMPTADLLMDHDPI